MKKSVSILGVTGSVGQSTADIIASDPDRFDVDVITAHKNWELLSETARRLRAKRVVIGDEQYADKLSDSLKGTDIIVYHGELATEECVAADTDLTVAAISGFAGLKPLLHAMKNSSAVAIANKEPLVAAGHLVMQAAEDYGTSILPIDSEHNAIFQVFDFDHPESIKRIILTASGGPFLRASEEEIANATPEQAVAHPNWDMGAKISVDSATMVNKALEVIEAHILFKMPAEKIDVVIHPQSVVHSFVEYTDGSVLAQMGPSDMRTPIAHALAWPERMTTPGETIDVTQLSSLEFEEADRTRFGALAMAYECLERGQAACLTMNTANEVAVDAFLQREIAFPDILACVRYAIDNQPDINLDTVDSVVRAHEAVREITKNYINEHINNLDQRDVG